MKKIVALVLCLVMVVGLMAGCQKKMDVETLTQKMDEAMKTVTAMGGDVKMDLEMQFAVTGMTMTMKLGMDMDMKSKMDFSQMYADANISMEMLGESQEISMEMYGTLEDGDLAYYAYESDTETWVKSTMEGYGELMEQLKGQTELQSFSVMPKEQMTLGEEKVKVNDRDCYVLTVNFDGAFFQSYMDENMEESFAQMEEELNAAAEGMDEAELEQAKAVMESMKDMDWSALNAQVVYHVDAESFLPVSTTMEIQGIGEMMQNLLSTMMGQMMIEMDEEMPAFTIEIPACKMVMENMVYNDAAEVPAVPQEAIDNAIDADAMVEEPIVDDPAYTGDVENLPQDDGSYVLTAETVSVQIMPPASCPYVGASADYLSAMNEDGSVCLTYMLLPGMDGESMTAGVLSEVDWAKENDYYKSHTEVAELDGCSTMALIYNDDTSIWYAWKELDGGVLLMGAEVLGESYDLSELVSSVMAAE